MGAVIADRLHRPVPAIQFGWIISKEEELEEAAVGEVAEVSRFLGRQPPTWMTNGTSVTSLTPCPIWSHVSLPHTIYEIFIFRFIYWKSVQILIIDLTFELNSVEYPVEKTWGDRYSDDEFNTIPITSNLLLSRFFLVRLHAIDLLDLMLQSIVFAFKIENDKKKR